MIEVLRKIWRFAGAEQNNIRKSMVLGFFYAIFHMFQIAAIYVVVLALVSGSTDPAPAWQALVLLLASILGRAVMNRFSQLQQTHAGYWNSQENRTPMSKTLSGKRVISEASPFDQWREIQFIGSVAPAAVVVGLDPAEYDLANLIPLHGGALEPVDQFLLQRCEKTLHARVVKAAMRAAHALPDGTEPGEHRPVLLAGVLAAVVGMQNQTFLVTIT